MLPTTTEWVTKAEGDWSTAQTVLRSRKAPYYDAVCFHAQQCAEKYLKARLEEAGIAFPPTHDLLRLLGLVLPCEPGWTVLDPDLRALMVYAVAVRYPGTTALRTDARHALANCANVRDHARRGLGLAV